MTAGRLAADRARRRLSVPARPRRFLSVIY